jgi:sodium/potassium-transporting ATPase subunit alpha
MNSYLEFIFNCKKEKRVYPIFDYNFQRISVEEIENQLNTSIVNGLSSEQAEERLEIYGKNIIKPEEIHVIIRFLAILLSGYNGFLWFASLISFLAWKPIGNPPQTSNLIQGIILLVMIFIQSIIELAQELHSENIMKSVIKLIPNLVDVVRDGKEIKIKPEDIVIGDLVILMPNSDVPADIRLVECNNMLFNKSLLTGESDLVPGSNQSVDSKYTEANNIAFMDTALILGYGKGIVVETGN